ncbi:MAG: hypothetical protein VX641_07795 [Planctomycetota bacterium]|nr:hypothetical protein [Planctomycetota bacterium]
MHTPQNRILACLALLTGTLLLGGCYQRVVSVKSGNYKGDVYEANVESDDENARSNGSQSSR